MVAAAPLAVNMLSAVSCWVIATVTLGHPPRPYVDDPRGIPAIAAPWMLWHLSGLLGCVTWVFVPHLAVGLLVLRGDHKRRRSRFIAISGLAVWAGATLLFFTGVTRWLAD